MSRVLIGIPTLNGSDRLLRAVASVHRHTNLHDVTILISDDNSSPEELDRNKSVAHKFNVPMLMTDARLGLAKQWNRIVRHVPNVEFVVLINDDVEVVPDWLDVLTFSLDKNPNIGTVGLRSEFGTIAAEAQARPRRDFQDSRLIDGCGTLLWSSGPCFAFRRADWSVVNGFDERYFVYYEDVDFGISLRKLGRSNVIAEYPVIFHMGGATMTHLDPQTVMKESAKKFAAKWGKSFAEFRAEFGAQPRATFMEWNSSWRDWK